MAPTRNARDTLRWRPGERISRALGRIASFEAPQPLLRGAIGLYVRAYRVDLSECDAPPDGFRTFNEFFARPLRKGARPIDPDPDAIVSPADGRLEDEGPIEAGARLIVKGRPYDVAELLGLPRGDETARRFDGGRFAVVYLSPRDYHRVHAPVSGPVVRARHVGGTLFPVNRLGVEHVANLFARNERVAVHQNSPRHGEIVTVLVGAMVVGGIDLSFDPEMTRHRHGPNVEMAYEDVVLRRGEEFGRFSLGSTAIVLTTPRATIRPVVRAGASIRVGEALHRLRAGATE